MPYAPTVAQRLPRRSFNTSMRSSVCLSPAVAHTCVFPCFKISCLTLSFLSSTRGSETITVPITHLTSVFRKLRSLLTSKTPMGPSWSLSMWLWSAIWSPRILSSKRSERWWPRKSIFRIHRWARMKWSRPILFTIVLRKNRSLRCSSPRWRNLTWAKNMNFTASIKTPRTPTSPATLSLSSTQMIQRFLRREPAPLSSHLRAKNVILWSQLKSVRSHCASRQATLASSLSLWITVISLIRLRLWRLSFLLRLLILLLSSAPTTKKFPSLPLAKTSVRDKKCTDHPTAQSLLKIWRTVVKIPSTIARLSSQASPNKFSPRLFLPIKTPRKKVASPMPSRLYLPLPLRRSNVPWFTITNFSAVSISMPC